jgi:hypothetical protein
VLSITKTQGIGGLSFYYGHPSSQCTRGFIAMSNYYTTLEYDGCIVFFFFSEFVDMPPRVWIIWRYEKAIGYTKNQLFGSYSKKMFQQCTRLSFDTFHVLIRVIGPSLE